MRIKVASDLDGISEWDIGIPLKDREDYKAGVAAERERIQSGWKLGPMLMMPESATIRDQFAMAAITGILATDPVGVTPDTLAHNSYVIADCMMEARKK